MTFPDDTKCIREEIWKIDRCGTKIDYQIRYAEEGDNGWSVRVIPKRWSDRFQALRFYMDF